MNTWDKLSMAEKAEIMRLAVAGGVYDLDAIRGGYNEFAKGGKIHIAPSKRGTFTAAAKRHGKSVQEFASQVLAHKGNYSPAMVKKANFARNASKWKHGYGGHIYDGTTEPTNQMDNIMSYNPEENYWTGPQTLLDPVTVTGNAPKKQKGLYPVRHKFKGFDNWTSPKGAGNMTVMPGDPEMVFFAPIAAGAGIAASPAIASTLGSAVSGINTAGDALAATAAGQRLTSGLNFVANAVGRSKAWPWIDAGLTSAFGTHGIDKIASGDIHNVGDVVETGLDLLPLSQLARPIISTVSKVGNTIKKTTPQITAENAASITPAQWTAAQDAAIARGDMAEAQRLRDLHFRGSAPNTKITEGVYHGSRRGKDFNSFDLKYFGYTDGGTGGYGHYFGPLNHATAYTNPRKFYLNVEDPYTGKHIQFFNRDSYFRDNELFGRIPSRENAIRYKEGFEKYKNEFAGKDGVIDNDPLWGKLGPVYTIPKGEQIKLADAVTYDDNGIRIPLGERDNFKLNDIRYSWLAPLIGLGTLGTMYGTSNKKQE